MTLLCAAPTNPDMGWVCLRPKGHPDFHLDHSPLCPLCDVTVPADTVYGPAMPARLDDGTAVLHRACRDRLAAERAGVAA
jgi:hypothetical protein